MLKFVEIAVLSCVVLATIANVIPPSIQDVCRSPYAGERDTIPVGETKIINLCRRCTCYSLPVFSCALIECPEHFGVPCASGWRKVDGECCGFCNRTDINVSLCTSKSNRF